MHDEEIERLKEALREQNSRLEAATRMLSAMQPLAPATLGSVQSVQPQPEPLPPAQLPSAAPPPAEQQLAPAAAQDPAPSVEQSGTAPLQSGGTSPFGALNPAHHEEMELLRERLREQDARLETTTRLLTSIRIPDPVASSPAPTPPSRMPQFAALGGAAALVILAGFLYLRSQAAHPMEQGQTATLVQPQLAAGAPSITQSSAPPKVAAAQPQAPALPPQPVAQPLAPGQAPPVAVAQPGSAPSSTLQVPAAQARGTQANAELPPLPLPDSQQGPPPDAVPRPDAVPPPDAVPVEKPAVDNVMSQNLTDYLHHHRLPFVDAMVYTRAGNPSSIALSGEVRTETGKEDAVTKSRIFLGIENVKVRNRVRINPELASNPKPTGVGEPAAASAAPEAAANPCSDLCQKDEGHCEIHCQDQTVGGAAGLAGGVSSFLGQLTQTTGQARDCTEDCHQTLEHCTADCSSGGSNEQSNGPPESRGGGGEGPNQPPS